MDGMQITQVFDFAWGAGSFLIDVVGVLALLTFVLTVIAGLVEPLWRFGTAVVYKKAFIVADAETAATIKGDLGRSGLIGEKNIILKNAQQINDLHGARLMVLDYDYLGDKKLMSIISGKDPRCGALVYAKPGSIKPDVMQELNDYQHVSVVNFRGRLVNELMLLMLTTSFTRVDIKNQEV